MPDVLFMEGEMQYFELELEQENNYHWLFNRKFTELFWLLQKPKTNFYAKINQNWGWYCEKLAVMTPLICGEVTKGNLIVNGILNFCIEIGPITHIIHW